jgi:hypothetical protein
VGHTGWHVIRVARPFVKAIRWSSPKVLKPPNRDIGIVHGLKAAIQQRPLANIARGSLRRMHGEKAVEGLLAALCEAVGPDRAVTAKRNAPLAEHQAPHYVADQRFEAFAINRYRKAGHYQSRLFRPYPLLPRCKVAMKALVFGKASGDVVRKTGGRPGMPPAEGKDRRGVVFEIGLLAIARRAGGNDGNFAAQWSCDERSRKHMVPCLRGTKLRAIGAGLP